MDELEFRNIMYQYLKEICHFSQLQVFATSSYQQKYFQKQIDEEMEAVFNLVMESCHHEMMKEKFGLEQQEQIWEIQALEENQN